MSSWFRRLTYPRVPPWSDEEENLGPPLRTPMSENTQDFPKSGMPTPATSTAVDHILPPPATHRRSSARTRIASRLDLGVYWVRLKKQLGTGLAPSNSSFLGDSTVESSTKREGQPVDEDGEVDAVVVDRAWSEEIKSSESSPSEHGANVMLFDRSAMGQTGPTVGKTSDHESEEPRGIGRILRPFVVLRYKFFPTLREFFFTRFEDEKSESHYAQEDWMLKKSLALWGALWLIVNWVVGVALLDKHNGTPEKSDIAFYYVVGPLLAIPVLWMVIYDWPRNRPISYQLFLVCAIWSWGFYIILYLKICRFYAKGPFGIPLHYCSTRDFLGTFFYTTALQTMGLFGLNLNRLMAAIGALCFFIMTSAIMIPDQTSWGRNMINFFVFHFFLIYVHYMREKSERRLYTLRYQLKAQWKATQKAQVNERKAADSKRRLTSYVFHVRVPLNTALLAVQNMHACGIVKEQQLEFSALSNSLIMMSKVLNDVLDFNKMDSGKFESASKPYAFHQTMQSLCNSVEIDTSSNGLAFAIFLDPNIDFVARKAAYEALGQEPDVIHRYIEDNPDIAGVVTGDEVRLRQVVTNLASNACKFTDKGGKVSIRTKLVLPVVPPGGNLLLTLQRNAAEEPPDEKPRYPLTASHLNQHDTEQELDEKGSKVSHSHSKTRSNSNVVKGSAADTIIVRIEVEDSGSGIKPSDMHKLFTAFNQTEQGRLQGGKGTGLGLALVRQIVKLSGGRLGVQSKVGRGSTFWVELPLGIGNDAVTTQFPSTGPDVARGYNHFEYLHGQPLIQRETAERENAGLITPENDAMGKYKEIGAAIATKESLVFDYTNEGGHSGNEVKRQKSGEPAFIRRPSGLSTCTYPSTALASEDEGDMAQGGGTAPTSNSDDTNTLNASVMPTPESEKGSDSKSMTTTTTTSSASNSTSYTSMSMAVSTLAIEEEIPEVEKGSSSSSSTPVPSAKRVIQRPTFVQLPSPRTFSIETQMPPISPSATYTPAIGSSYSTSSTSPLAMFDANYARGSPSSLNAGMSFESVGMPVLVVDDDPLTRTLMKKILTRLGCQVSCAENGEVALEMILGRRISIPVSTPSSDYSMTREMKPILEQEVSPHRSTCASTPPGPSDEYKYAVIFLDNQMPKMSGLKVVAKLRELERKDFVVGVTGNALLADQQEYLEAGVDKVLTKPVLERSLRDALHSADEKRKKFIRETNSPEIARAPPSR